jgi:transcriptional regulator with XRE-family HTH domain
MPHAVVFLPWSKGEDSQKIGALEASMRTEIRYGKHVKELREEHGWTQEHLASIAGMDVRTVQRVEKDITKGNEALMAISSAFGLTVGELGRKYWIAESRPLQALTIRKGSDFAEAISRASHFYSYRTFGDLCPETDAAAQPLIEEIFADIWAMSPGEPELVQSWCHSVEEPLDQLHGLGLQILSIQEKRDVFMRDRDGSPLPFEDCSYCYFVIMPKHAVFHLGGSGSQSPVHRFNDQCTTAVTSILSLQKKPEMIGLAATAVHLIQLVGGEDKLHWCDSCFPRDEEGLRAGWAYMEDIFGLSKEDLLRMISRSEDVPIIGLA